MPITSGLIRYERRLPKDAANSWNYKHVVSEIHWTVEPDEMEEDLAAYAVDKVVRRVKDVLNWKPPEVQWIEKSADLAALVEATANLDPNTTFAVSPSQAEDIAKQNIEVPNLATAVAEITAGIPPTLKRHRRTKAEMEAARAAEANPTSSADPAPSSTEPGMPSFDPDPTPPAEVTDPDLQNACQARASSGVPVINIKELIAKFSPGGPPLIPQNARRRFLEELAKL